LYSVHRVNVKRNVHMVNIHNLLNQFVINGAP